MTPNEEKLFAVLKERSFRSGEFVLASGDRSTYFIDGKMSMVSSAGAYLIGQVLFEHSQDLAFDAIGGLAAGAIPLATSAAIGYHLNGRPMEGFWVRNEVKDHGTKKRVEGNVKPGSRVVILEDVVTRGQSALKAIDAVREIGCEVVRVLTLVDRLQGGEALFREKGITDYRAVFTIRDFGVTVG
jgi:orotate phosphoribosyltransferase